MRKLLVLGLIVIGFAITACAGQEAQKDVYLFSYFQGNGEDGLHLAYSLDGYTFKALNNNESFLKPELTADKLMRDPCIIQGPDGLYHMAWTVSWWEKGIGYANSEDLIHWSEQQYIPVMEHEPDAKNCWAPELYYDEANARYLIFWATTIPGRFPETDNQSSEEPPAPGNNHRMYYTWTKDFQEFADTEIFYNKGFNVIDATIEKEGDTYMMFLKDETNKPFEPQKNIRLATADQAAGPYSEPSEPITGDYWAEGPTAIKIDGKWIVYFDKYIDHNMGAVMSEDLENWTDISGRINFPEGTRHGTVYRVPWEVLDRLMEVGG
ncbi:MAG: glycoside hydrolase family 43 protein [Candidatus Marinimicrobia bacterium]|nr:glycoside hydrolase family 43 protein [Candidatus Neomarinimicrobiota bacterium]MCF7830047.1 glycoside hydrolase family 43 protein [Candidatus Neomarinimicrobiota bacterium]MCF7881913.1 glycoside hydrolase family 43 protein [Candidatus Neomarinimicrobiota bacterium]